MRCGQETHNPRFVRTTEYLKVETQIDIRRIEMSSRYDRPLWKPVNEKQFDVRLSAFGPGTSSECFRMETARTPDEDYGKHVKIYTDESKMGDKVRNAVEFYLQTRCSVCSLQLLKQ
jgi:hypothetical protein